MVTQSFAANPLLAAPSMQQVRRIVPLCVIILAHIGFFYALQSGLLKQPGRTNQAETKEIFASLITADSPRELVPQKQPAVLQPVPQPAPRRLEPPTPVKPIPQQKAPSEHAITTPPVAPQPAAQPQPAAPAAAAASTASTTASPTQTAPAQLKSVTSGIEYVQAPQPDYPSISKRMGEEGRVILRVLVNEKGRAERVEVHTSSGSTRLDEAARQALARTIFKPHSEDGKAVAMSALVPITFHLDK